MNDMQFLGMLLALSGGLLGYAIGIYRGYRLAYRETEDLVRAMARGGNNEPD